MTEPKFPPAVLRPDRLTPTDRGGGARTIPLVTRPIGAEVFLNGMTIFDPGAGIPLHTHNCEECVVILDGDAIAEIDGVEHRLGRWDTTYVAAGVPAPIPQRLRLRADAHPVDVRVGRRHPHDRGDRRDQPCGRGARDAALTADLTEPLDIDGRLRRGITGTDLALPLTELRRSAGVVDTFVEFFGSGLAELGWAARAAVANMAPEYGATCAFFPYDEQTAGYLRHGGLLPYVLSGMTS